MTSKERKRLKRIKQVMKGKRDIETLSLKELVKLDELMFEAVMVMNQDRLMPPSNEIH